MRIARPALPNFSLPAAVLIAFAASLLPAQSQTAPERDAIVSQLSQFDTGPELDLAALKQRVLDKSRSRARNEPEPAKRPVPVPEILNLPTFTVDIHFDTDTPVIRPDSYQAVGRIADALVNAQLLPYTFLIVGHSDATGKREANAILSQRRADSVRDVLVNTFKISSKRVQSLGLGEEQFVDQAHPTSPANLQIQILTIGKVAEIEPSQTPATQPPAAAKKGGKKK
jgi:outer membrane protein OmpA-like peptidoglycan-associated protein